MKKPKFGKWTSMEDCQPREKQLVITFFEITGIEIARYTKLTGEAGQMGLQCFYNKSGYLTDDVTEWMPLPPLPKGRKTATWDKKEEEIKINGPGSLTCDRAGPVTIEDCKSCFGTGSCMYGKEQKGET